MSTRVLAICGSLRAKSYNLMLLRAAQQLAPKALDITLLTLEDIPLFNQDLESSLPEPVVNLKQRIEQADAILISTPEYNYSIPGVLKNAMDWASRPQGDNSFNDKPVAVMGATPYGLGASRAIYHLRQTFVFLNMHALQKPEIMVPFAGDKFDASGALIDADTRDRLAAFLTAFEAWIKRVTLH